MNENNYKDFLIINTDGVIIHSNISNLQYFNLDRESITGKRLKEIYTDTDGNYPTLKAAREGIAYRNFELQLTTSRGIKIKKVGCAYPVFMDGAPVAAIEFGEFIYDREHIREIENRYDDMIFRQNNTKYTLDSIITKNNRMIELKRQIEKFALSDSAVLIYGETGTGKELVAQSIHNRSRRFAKKFVSVNCGTIPENIAEGLIFGTTKGSFTGAENKPGIFEHADGGTLFLDEINSLSPQLQIKLLRAIESKMIRRVGALKEQHVDVRIIAATNERPSNLIAQKRMKADFYHRVAAIYITIPRLIDRGDDVLVLTDHFTNYFNKLMNNNIKPFSKEIKDTFMQYSWPGNVRELRNVIEGAFSLVEGDTVTMNEIPRYLKSSMRSKPQRHIEHAGLLCDLPDCGVGLKGIMSGIENALVKEAMNLGENTTHAAELLGISKQLLNYKLHRDIM